MILGCLEGFQFLSELSGAPHGVRPLAQVFLLPCLGFSVDGLPAGGLPLLTFSPGLLQLGLQVFRFGLRFLGPLLLPGLRGIQSRDISSVLLLPRDFFLNIRVFFADSYQVFFRPEVDPLQKTSGRLLDLRDCGVGWILRVGDRGICWKLRGSLGLPSLRSHVASQSLFRSPRTAPTVSGYLRHKQ